MTNIAKRKPKAANKAVKTETKKPAKMTVPTAPESLWVTVAEGKVTGTHPSRSAARTSGMGTPRKYTLA